MSKAIYLNLVLIHLLYACGESKNSTPRGYQCKGCILYQSDNMGDALAPVDGPIKTSHVSAIKPDSKYTPSKNELLGNLKREPRSDDSDPIKVEDLEDLPLKEQQIIRILVNQGHLVEKNSYFVGYDGTVLNMSNLEDFISRFEMALNYQNKKEEAKSKTTEESSLEDSETRAKSAAQVVSVLGAVGTFFWGYREWTTNSGIIEQAKADYREKIALEQRFDDIDKAIQKGNDVRPIFNKTEISGPKKPKFGPVYDPSSAKFGKYVFSPLLIATSAILMGLSIEDIRN